MMNLPVPSWRTTRAIAHLRRPVPKIFCAAKPPGSRDLTYFSRSTVPISSAGASANPAAAAETARGRVLGAERRKERGFPAGKGMERGWEDAEERWEEKERAEKWEQSEAVAIATDLRLRRPCCVWLCQRGGRMQITQVSNDSNSPYFVSKSERERLELSTN